jgi:hypothetical protein
MPTPNEPIQYTETEIRSYLPAGWDLIGDRRNAWNPKQRVWRATVLDNVEFDWPLEVTAKEVGEQGRLEALRRAFDRLVRERLG